MMKSWRLRRAHSSTTRRTVLAPARWPAKRGRPRWRAQRPLPSMMMATWRGRRSGAMPRIGGGETDAVVVMGVFITQRPRGSKQALGDGVDPVVGGVMGEEPGVALGGKLIGGGAVVKQMFDGAA